MARFHEEIDVDRTPEEVWSYVTDPAHLPDWQAGAIAAEQLDPGPLRVGSRIRVTRHVGHREVPMTMEFTEYNPPRTWSLTGLDGPVRAHFRGEIYALDEGRRSRVTMDLYFDSHGIGKLLLPLIIRPQIRKELPVNERRLKRLLEQQAA